MIEKKCEICGEWKASKTIAMHYWNLHRVKYKDYRDKEESREVEDPITEEVIEETKKQENIVNYVKEETTPIQKDEVKKEINAVYKHDFYDEGEVINEWC